MTEIIYRIPSKVPYGYVEVRFENDHRPLADQLAADYASYFLAYKEAEEAALKAPTKVQAKHNVKPLVQVLADPPEETDDAAVLESVKALIGKELGGVEIDDDADAPWNNKPEPAKKPYAVDDSDWDFG